MKKLIIAIDGHSSCGKSTLAKDMAGKLNYIYIDSGAMYRAVTLFFLREGIEPEDHEAVKKAIENINIRFENTDAGIQTILNGENVEEEIRKMHVSEKVSPVAAIPAVRRLLVEQQRTMGKNKGIVMDGRDIGTVVFPDAELKIFLTASTETRALRRQLELTEKGVSVTLEEIEKNVILRDHIDSTREDSPLKKAEDAIEIDNTLLDREEQLEKAMGLVVGEEV